MPKIEICESKDWVSDSRTYALAWGLPGVILIIGMAAWEGLFSKGSHSYDEGYALIKCCGRGEYCDVCLSAAASVVKVGLRPPLQER